MHRRGLALAMAFAVAACGAAMAQDESGYPDVRYPGLQASGATVDAFVPKGWNIEQQSRGDLNKDGRDDAVLVLRMLDKTNVVKNDGLGPDEFDTNPRMLAVLFADATGYRLAVEDHALIPRPDNPVMDDYLGGGDAVQVRRGGFSVTLHAWASAGSWSTSNTTFTFRHQDGCFRLIGYDHGGLHRGSGETNSISINYSTRKAVLETGSMESDVPLTSKTVTMPRGPLPCLQDVGNGFEFDPGVSG